MQFKLTDLVVLLAATSALTGVSLATSSPVSAQVQTSNSMMGKVKESREMSRIAMPHSNYGKLKAELARSQDPAKNAILQAAVDRLMKSHPGGVADDRWSFSLVFTLVWGSMMQDKSGGAIHD